MHGLGPTRTRVLALLQAGDGPQGVGSVADALSLHRNSARFHLDALVEAGFAERSTLPSGRSGRPPLLYAATTSSPVIGNAHLLELSKALLTEFTDPTETMAVRAISAGRRWGGDVQASIVDVATLKAQLVQRGFGVQTTDEEILFTRCPFREQFDQQQLPLVCAMHEGMITGFVEGSDIEVGPIRIGPRQCSAALGSRSSAS